MYQKELRADIVENVKKEILTLSGWISWPGRDRVVQRYTVEFGFSFKVAEQKGRREDLPIPPFVMELRRAAVERLRTHLKVTAPEQYENCILTVYDTGGKIDAHTDRPCFGDEIVGVIIEPDTATNGLSSKLCFRFGQKKHLLQERKGTAYAITGSLRWTPLSRPFFARNKLMTAGSWF